MSESKPKKACERRRKAWCQLLSKKAVYPRKSEEDQHNVAKGLKQQLAPEGKTDLIRRRRGGRGGKKGVKRRQDAVGRSKRPPLKDILKASDWERRHWKPDHWRKPLIQKGGFSKKSRFLKGAWRPASSGKNRLRAKGKKKLRAKLKGRCRTAAWLEERNRVCGLEKQVSGDKQSTPGENRIREKDFRGHQTKKERSRGKIEGQSRKSKTPQSIDFWGWPGKKKKKKKKGRGRWGE